MPYEQCHVHCSVRVSLLPCPPAGACPRPHRGMGLWVSTPHCPCARGHVRSSAHTCVQHVHDRLFTWPEVGSNRDEASFEALMSQIVGFPCWMLAVGPIWYLTSSYRAADEFVIVPFGSGEFCSCVVTLFWSHQTQHSVHVTLYMSLGDRETEV